jgi:hypothetical protein
MRPHSLCIVLSLCVGGLTLAVACERTESRPAQPTSVAPPAQQAPQPRPVARADLPPLPNPLPGRREDVSSWVGMALRAAIADLDGDGDGEIVLVDAERIRVLERSGRELAQAPVPGGIQVLATADLDGDGRAEVFAGFGMTREHMDGRATVTVHRLQEGRLETETVIAPRTTRQDVAAIVPMPDAGSLLIAYFESKYMVQSVVTKRGASGWEAAPIASLRMATSYARGDVDGDGKTDLVVGRVYGDDTGKDGDAFVLAPDGARTPIPTTRGVRSLAVADTDGDGRAEVFLGDGWHQAYAQNARGLLTWARRTSTGFESALIEDTPGQYAIGQIVPAAIDGEIVILASGGQYVRAFAREADAWRGLTVAGAARDVAVGALDAAPGDEILVVGERSEIIHLSRADWLR